MSTPEVARDVEVGLSTWRALFSQTGLVSITAGCSVVMPWAAVVIGVVGGMVYLGASALVKKCKIDDPLDAGAVHGFGGIWGMLAVGFFAEPGYSCAPRILNTHAHAHIGTHS